ncbi:DUF6326 family protein [Pedobacter nutrimenti]|uniref:DoxX-like protein n=1 Tax=Pedobacter nutrimenti TaxID=1241337 RepID=A0A318UM59_9SPHI|nr:DUF6326 family protein [Pedobacter nutrimenti]PYF77083.1 hypothetical protein B0O44_101562 [Pedobacter nutrimenti]
MKQAQQYQNTEINPKIRLALLWVAVTLCYLYGDYFELYVPKKVEGLISGDNLLNTPFKLFLAALMLAVPALMVVSSILLRPVLNRVLNIIFGIFYTLIMVLVGVSSYDKWMLFYIFLAFVECVITLLIVRYAWIWPKER